VKRNAIVIPIYMGHVSRFVGLLNGLANVDTHDAEVVFLASNAIEQAAFSRIAAVIAPTVLIWDANALAERLHPEAATRLRENRQGCVINLKKLIGIQTCVEAGCQRIAVIDSDVMLLPSFHAGRLLDALATDYERRRYLGGQVNSQPYQDVMSASIRFVGLNESSKAPELGLDRWYGWFFELPFYTADDFSAFLRFLAQRYPEGWWHHVTWHTFDHLVYVYWLVSCGSATLDHYSDIASNIPELLTVPELAGVWQARGVRPSWVGLKQFLQYPEIRDLNPNLQVLCHLDRL